MVDMSKNTGHITKQRTAYTGINEIRNILSRIRKHNKVPIMPIIKIYSTILTNSIPTPAACEFVINITIIVGIAVINATAVIYKKAPI